MGSSDVTITAGRLGFDYRYQNADGTLRIFGGESRLSLHQDIAFTHVFFGETLLPDGVHDWAFFDGLGAAIAGDYGAGAVTSMKSPIIDHTGIDRPKLSFQCYIDTTLDVGGGQLRFSTEAGEVLFTRQEIFFGKTEAWTFFSLTIPCEWS